ncbi:peroxiredoxin-like family protein [Curvivirga aplysinae]|uniref:peroxiredoxin-like family protein n=1 Tax=Curvivirga aplysinae TaxID=2529852 RepID=UPI0012BD478E|nr:peroxiredoxin-like family protein [Curvivirga aplysinae]MTI09676.1 AhpC/TSA family protein [Curvivirga aplysinae]
MLLPRKETPDLALPTVSHGDYKLSTDAPENFSLVVFYRGLHCPICATYLKELERLSEDFAAKGVKIIAVSSDGEERAKEMADKIGATNLRVAYDLPLAKAKEWGLSISTSRGKTSIGIMEPDLFSEPGVFLVKPDQTLYYASVQTMPFVRPVFKEMLGALDFVIANDYPARGEYTGEV